MSVQKGRPFAVIGPVWGRGLSNSPASCGHSAFTRLYGLAVNRYEHIPLLDFQAFSQCAGLYGMHHQRLVEIELATIPQAHAGKQDAGCLDAISLDDPSSRLQTACHSHPISGPNDLQFSNPY